MTRFILGPAARRGTRVELAGFGGFSAADARSEAWVSRSGAFGIILGGGAQGSPAWPAQAAPARALARALRRDSGGRRGAPRKARTRVHSGRGGCSRWRGLRQLLS